MGVSHRKAPFMEGPIFPVEMYQALELLPNSAVVGREYFSTLTDEAGLVFPGLGVGLFLRGLLIVGDPDPLDQLVEAGHVVGDVGGKDGVS